MTWSINSIPSQEDRIAFVTGANSGLGFDTAKTLLKKNEQVKSLKTGDEGMIIVNQTPFYGESGGQVGDQGIIYSSDCKIKIKDPQKKLGDLYNNKGKGEKEVGYISKLNQPMKHLKVNDIIIKVDPIYYRPTEVDTLLGDASKARQVLNWKPEYNFKTLVEEMIEQDLLLSLIHI
mgnify:CR=1 FL=1